MITNPIAVLHQANNATKPEPLAKHPGEAVVIGVSQELMDSLEALKLVNPSLFSKPPVPSATLCVAGFGVAVDKSLTGRETKILLTATEYYKPLLEEVKCSFPGCEVKAKRHTLATVVLKKLDRESLDGPFIEGGAVFCLTHGFQVIEVLNTLGSKEWAMVEPVALKENESVINDFRARLHLPVE